MIFPLGCIFIRNDKVISLKENKSCFRFLNPDQKEVKCIVVDGGAITDGFRCDHLLIDANKMEHFIELKGRDIPHAVEQLEASIQQLSSNNGFKYSFIVSTRCPLSGSDIQIFKKKFKQKYHSELIIKNLLCEHSHS